MTESSRMATGSSPRTQDPNGDVRLIQLADIGVGLFRNRSTRFLTASKAAELGCTYLAPNDVLIARMPEPLGRACIFRGVDRPAVTAVDVCIVRTHPDDIDPPWLVWCINSPQFRRQVKEFESGTTRKRISRKNLGRIQFPLPPVLEQRRIAEEISRQFSILDSVAQTAKSTLTSANGLRRRILEEAFAGRLALRNPTDEPAGALLERLEKAEVGR